MRIKALNPSYSEPNRYAFDQPKILVYEGDLAPLPKWAEKGSIALTTNNPLYPVRLIDSSMILSIDDDDKIDESEIKTEIKTFTIKGSRGNEYIVTVTPHGKSCSCVGYEFRRHCRHLNMVCA